MNSSFSTLSASLLEMLSDILDMIEQLHTASMEFTVLRDNGLPVGLEVNIQCLLTEQNDLHLEKIEISDVEKFKRFLKWANENKETVTTNC